MIKKLMFFCLFVCFSAFGHNKKTIKRFNKRIYGVERLLLLNNEKLEGLKHAVKAVERVYSEKCRLINQQNNILKKYITKKYRKIERRKR